MVQSMDGLPEALLDDLVTQILNDSPSLRASFLSAFGSRTHASTVRVLFSTLIIPDDARPSIFFKRAVSAVFSNPERYACTVKSLVFEDPDFNGTWNRSQESHNSKGEQMVGSPNTLCALEASRIFALLKSCANLEEIVWESSLPPPDGICEMLSGNQRLTRFSYAPRSQTGPTARMCTPKWSSPSLPLLAPFALTSLRLNHLSQLGSRALCKLLSNISEYSSLDDVSIDFVFLDDQLCERIVEAGRRIKKLRIGTSGTKLTDKGISTLVEGCDALEELVLEEVQGRLSRSLWTRPSHFPASLRRFKILIRESGPHHSWTTDHLSSIHALPLQSLEELSILRRESPPQLEHGKPTYGSQSLDDVLALKAVPEEFVDRIKEARELTKFECDWWSWSVSDLKIVLESCPRLKMIRLCLDAPFSKLLNLTSTFATLVDLQQLFICVSPAHAPGKPPGPLLPTRRPSLPTPTESPVLKAKSVLPQLLDFDQMQTQTCLANETVTGDVSMPLIRDVKRFVRKCPKLTVLQWYGKAGRGSWYVTRPATTTSKISTNVSVEYTPPTISEGTWKALLQEKGMEEALKAGFWSQTERVGQTWTGDVAEAFALEREKVDANDKEREKERPTRPSRKGSRTAPILTCSSSGGNDNLPPSPTPSSYFSPSPAQTFSPLTPPNSDTSLSTQQLPCVSEGVSEASSNNYRDLASLGRKRAPSEPGSRSNTHTNGRTRSATASSSGNGSSSNVKATTTNPRTSNGGFKSGRGRGGSTGGRDAKKNANGSSNGQTSNGTGRGRGGGPGRGTNPNHSSASRSRGKKAST